MDLAVARISAKPQLSTCDFEDEYCDCRQLATVHDLATDREFCARHNLVLISDDIHCDLLLEKGAVHEPFAVAAPGGSARTVTLMAPSKTYNIPGLGTSFAIIEDRSVVDAKATVTQSWVGPDTFVGSMTAVTDSLAWGATLTSWQTDSSLRVPDPFLLSSLSTGPASTTSEGTGRAFERRQPTVSFFATLRARVARGIDPKPARYGGQ